MEYHSSVLYNKEKRVLYTLAVGYSGHICLHVIYSRINKGQEKGQ